MGTLPPGAIYIGRGSPWGNRFVIGEHGDRDQVCNQFECEGVRESAQNISLSSVGWVIGGPAFPRNYPQPLGGLERKQTDNCGEIL
jgi:hypothetical protein